MANQKAIRARISSVRKTQKITKAMKMVSAAKLSRAQHAIQAARPYADRYASTAFGKVYINGRYRTRTCDLSGVIRAL